ncbi:winged helix-turn-helix domain-containing protein [Amycolatopsis sp. FBCC-B4732]|uniref:BTAD domain-containing putative transcriptional regulator n=1 Tax=Amycolatopsis sp. FBCC-B4732 TaxID=3079339 RepID=UPI001FF4FD80|nr:BTAD domain-containing putative transcriptional regulator [Amycolatopsis sp. FBCC-B4732]UOX91168.1 winged helix-turn-helix domain-containing protein [Amycolatopsis sp. FBCC-B4732]
MHRRAPVAEPKARLTVLGPPGAVDGDGTGLDLGSPQQQAVLLALLAGGGRFVPTGELIDGLWGERAPATGEAVVRTYISRLRRVLAGHGLGAAIHSRAGGYLLDPAAFAVDATEFTRLAETARVDRAAGNAAAAAEHLEEALALWTGTALAGVPGEAAERERARLERLKLLATQDLLRLRLELGRHAEVVAEVPALIELNRLEEPLYEIHLLALDRGGRRAEALAVYRAVHDLFGRELGIAPGPRLREIHEGILRAGEPRRAPAGRARWFVGRDAERAAFAAVLNRGGTLFLRGPAGIGKSTLLRRFADDAAAAGRPAWLLHGLTTAELRSRLEQVSLDAPSPVLLVDSFERHRELEPWLREDYLPGLPGDAVVVVAGRHGPGVAWRTDPAFAGTLTVRHLGTLGPAESAALLDARGIAPGLGASIVDFAAGHPLVLALAAEVGRDLTGAGQPARREAVRYVVDTVLEVLLDDVPTGRHWQALYVCAHARYTTEDLLRVAIPDGDAAELFDWLRAQPCAGTPGHGLDVDGVLRAALDAHLRWRDPAGYARMHRRIRDHAFTTLLREATEPEAAVAVVRTLGHLCGGVLRRSVSVAGEAGVRASVVTPAEHDELVALARHTHGEATAASVRSWLDRRPEAFTVLRGDGRVRAFLSRLTFGDLDELAGDPALAAIRRDADLPAGKHLAVTRHLVGPAGPGPVTDVLLARLLRDWLHDPGLAASYVVVRREWWEPLLDHLGHGEIGAPHAESAVFGHDWLADPPARWRERHVEDELRDRVNLFQPNVKE